MLPELNPQLIHDFRKKVHENNNFVCQYFVNFKSKYDEEGKDVWSKICSCMDWLTVAIEGIERPKINKNMNCSSLEFTHFLVTIDMIIEAITHLWMAIGGATKSKQPYIEDRSIFQATEFDRKYTDEKYIKEIRSWFGVHAVNGNEVQLDGFKKGIRFFSSWSGSSDGKSFSIQLYSNNRSAEEKYGGTKKIEVDCLVKFAALRYNTLTQLMDEIDLLYSNVKKELQKLRVQLDDSKSECAQLQQLYSQAKERKLTSEHYEDDILKYISFLECDLNELQERERELVSDYLLELKRIIPIYKNIIQEVDHREFDVFENLHMRSQIYADNSYEFSKTLEYAEGHSLYGSGDITLRTLINKGLLPEYSVHLSGSCLSLLIHALDYKHNKIHPKKIKKSKFVQIIDDISYPSVLITRKNGKVIITEKYNNDIKDLTKEDSKDNWK
ncbi:hypothetical protein MKY06_30175 [Priestia sp. FSL P4-0332]|uniref:hypothetical protein n=1 Tax=Priestia sp. FSL P4-0332 TaxID=2921634 RepID=UPI0030F803E4